jgi:hypothetical protein
MVFKLPLPVGGLESCQEYFCVHVAKAGLKRVL